MNERLNVMLSRANQRGFGILDGGSGSEYPRRRYPNLVTPPAWTLGPLLTKEGRSVTAEIAGDYAAHAELITTNTFRTQERSVRRYLQHINETNVDPAELARQATLWACEAARTGVQQSRKQDVVILGGMAPLENNDEPDLSRQIPGHILQEEHTTHALHLKEGGVDALLIETMGTLPEILAAARAAATVELPYIVSLYCNTTDGSLLVGGDRVAEVAEALLGLSYPPTAIGVNCGSLNTMTTALEAMYPVDQGKTPRIVYPNGYTPPDEGQQDAEWVWSRGATDQQILDQIPPWLGLGAKIIGGCCGTTPDTIQRIRQYRDN